MLSISFTNSVYDKKTTINMLNDIDKVDFIHVDLMDGNYVPVCNFEIDEIIDILKDITKPLDIHLMVSDPLKYIDALASLKPKYITFHPDACQSPEEVINKIKSYGINVGLSVNSFIDIDEYSYLYDRIDLLLIMSVKAGYGGQLFLEETYNKLNEIENLKDNHHILIEIDGGINKEIYDNLKNKYPIDIYVVGSYICMNENFIRPIESLID